MIRTSRRALGMAAFCTLLGGCGAGHESTSPEIWERHRQPPSLAAYDGAALLDDGDRAWVARVDSPMAVVPRIALRHHDWDLDPAQQPVLASVVGTNPSLTRLDSTTLGLLYRAVLEDGTCQFRFRRFDTVSRRWSRPVPVTTDRTTPLGGNARLLRTSTATLLFPVTELSEPGVLSTARVIVYASVDGGAHWQRRPLPFGAALGPMLAEPAPGVLVLVVNCLGKLHRAVSTDAGVTWSALVSIGIAAQESPHALVRLDTTSTLLVAWTEAQPHEREVAPAIRALRCAVSADTGRSWSAAHTLVVRPPEQPRAPALCAGAHDLHVAFESSRDGERHPRLLSMPLDALFARAPGAAPPVRRRDHLRALVAHTIARPDRETYLFVECSLMRMLVAAHRALAPFAAEHADWLQTERGMLRAREFADDLVRRQQPSGYWSIGYKSRFVADMAVGIGLFRALAPSVDATRRQAYVGATRRFMAAMERDGLLLAHGAVGVGKPETQPIRLDRTPYIVATALVGAVARAWLYAETHVEADRRGSVASLLWLAAQIGADGSVPAFQKESSLIAAAYMGEAWMAAMPLLSPAEARAVAPALQRHLQWLLRTQRDDGTWGTPESGVPERAPLIVHFLLWAEKQGLEPSALHVALARAEATLDFDAWRDAALFAPGTEVYRAMAGIPLAAIVQGTPVD